MLQLIMNNNEKKGTCAGDDWVNNEMFYRNTQPTVAFRQSLDENPLTIVVLIISKSIICGIKIDAYAAESILLY